MTDVRPRTSADAYLAELAHRLGNGGAARDALDELRDHLLTARDAYISQGEDEVLATERAVKTLGPQADLVKELRAEMRRERIARGACALLVGTFALGLLWLVILATGPRLPWTEQREPLALEWSDAIGVASMRAAVVIAIIANALSWGPVRARLQSSIEDRVETYSLALCRLAGGALALAVSSILIYVGVRLSLAPRSLEVSDVTLGALLTVATIPFVLLPIVRSGRSSV